MSKLTPKQEAFVREYLASPKLNAVEAALAAGYSQASARYASRDILTVPRVRAAIDAEMEKRAARAGDSQDKVLADIARIGRAAEHARRFDAALRAAQLRGMHLGMFKEKVEVSGPAGGPIETVTRVELVAPSVDGKG
jgi:phage terminase small subunit